MNKKIKISIVGTRGYPYVYSCYETFVKELSERLVKKGCDVTVYCHRALFIEKPKTINGIDLVYIPTIETKVLSQFIHSFFSDLRDRNYKENKKKNISADNMSRIKFIKILGRECVHINI